MRLLKSFALFLPLVIGGKAHSQMIADDSLKKERKIIYFFNVQAGSLIGCNECKVGKEVTFSTSTLHGVQLGKRLRVGGGIGFDSYRDWQAIPFFGSVAFDLVGKKNKVFAQINYGWAKAWKPFEDNVYGFKEAKGGESYTMSLGYRIHYGAVRMAILLGYKLQRAEAKYEYPYFIYNNTLPPEILPGSSRTVSEKMNRFALSLSVGWK